MKPNLFELSISGLRSGWFRILGRGIGWKPIESRDLFSVQHGIVKTLKIGRVKFNILPRLS